MTDLILDFKGDFNFLLRRSSHLRPLKKGCCLAYSRVRRLLGFLFSRPCNKLVNLLLK